MADGAAGDGVTGNSAASAAPEPGTGDGRTRPDGRTGVDVGKTTTARVGAGVGAVVGGGVNVGHGVAVGEGV